jgi:hypothetical protein
MLCVGQQPDGFDYSYRESISDWRRGRRREETELSLKRIHGREQDASKAGREP